MRVTVCNKMLLKTNKTAVLFCNSITV